MESSSTENPDPTEAEASPPEVPDTAESLKQKGNTAVRNEKFSEAILHYSFAIKLSPNDPILYSNRSFAFLRLQQLYYANEDAEKAIQLKPDWAKGYFRRAEVQAAAGQYDTSLLSYGRAMQLQPNDISILNAAKKVASLSNRDTLYAGRIPWVGAGIGIILGAIIVISDQLLTKTPAVKHPSLMVLLVMAVSGVCFGIAKLYYYYAKLQQRGLLEPPVDMLDGFRKDKSGGGAVDPDAFEDDSELTPNRNRYSKAQARQRFRKGKS